MVQDDRDKRCWEYWTLSGDEFRPMHLRALIGYLQSQKPRPAVWSARLSTGIFGHTDCPSGNRSPKGTNNVLLAVGDNGLRGLIELGFIPCPDCKPEQADGFWMVAAGIVGIKYGITTLKEFVDKDVALPHDVMRVNWEILVPRMRTWPDRLYVKQGLDADTLADIASDIKAIGYGLPDIGYYDQDSSEHFTRYTIA